jgi:hypothetical protein
VDCGFGLPRAEGLLSKKTYEGVSFFSDRRIRNGWSRLDERGRKGARPTELERDAAASPLPMAESSLALPNWVLQCMIFNSVGMGRKRRERRP